MHKLLARQVQRYLRGAPPPELDAFLRAVDDAYGSSEADLRQLERSLELSSRELLSLNEKLRQEIEAERAARQSLARGRADFLEVVQRVPFPTAIRSGRCYAFANRAWSALLGRGPDELIGRGVLEDVVEEDRAAVLANVARTDAGAENPPLSSHWRRKDGGVIEVEVHVVWQLDFEGAPAQLLAAEDVTERKRLQAQLVTADRMVSVGTLAAGVAHEINNPLAYVLSSLEYLADDLPALLSPATSAEPLEALTDALEGVRRVRQIVRDLKIFSRSDEELHDRVDLHAVIESAASLARNEVRHRAKLLKELSPVPPVSGNEGKLAQVFLNLLVNAAQAIPDGAADRNEIRVRCATSPSGDAVVEIADTGCGIPDAILRRIFDPFFTTKPIGVGTGLGLSICQGIVHAHGGRLEVESQVGSGSVFRVTLPPAAGALTTAPAVAASPPRAPRKRLLVVDDEVQIGGAIRRALAGEHDVTSSACAREALSLLTAGEPFDLVLCDVMMPEMTGEDLHRELQRVRPALAEKMIFMSGGVFSPGARQFLDRVGNRHIDKPVEIRLLRALLAEPG